MDSVTMVPASKRAELQTENRDDGHESVGKSVAEEHAPLRQAFGARGTHVIAPQFFDHRAAHHAREDRGQRGA